MSEKITVRAAGTGVEIVANREGLMGLADVCLRLAALPESRDESRRMGNHYHYAESMNNAEPGSLDLVILYDPEM